MPRAVTVTYAVWPSPAEVAAAAADAFASAAASAAKARGIARIAISGGTTPKAMFAVLADRSQPYFERVPWEKLHLFWVDERTVPPDHKDSNYGMTKAAMLDRVRLRPEQVHRIEGELEPEVAASRYEADIRTSFRLEGAESPTFDLVLLGMGDDGHTASLFPHTEALNELGRIAVANRVEKLNTWRITLTWPVINQAREVVFLIEGAGKREILRDVLLGGYDPDTKPSQLIRPASGKLIFLLDAAAGAALPNAGAENAPYTASLELK
jgi:6-phosphogluconolactonase